jgi:hypothetical protein
LKRPLAWRTFTLLASLLLVVSAPAQSQGQQRGDGSMRMEYQFIRTGTFHAQGLEFDYWSTDTQVLLLSGDYAINDRWTLFASLPYVSKKFISKVDWGGDPHNPNDPYWINFVPPDKRFWDDGDYHGALQDFSIGVSYRVVKDNWTLNPYISYGVPASDYPFFAKASIGRNLWTIPVGLSFSFVPYFSDWHFDGNVAYVFAEEPLGQNVDYWLFHLSAGYWFKSNLSVNAFLTRKDTNGWSLLDPDFSNGSDPDNYPTGWDTEAWWHHDRLVGSRSMNLGVGVEYFLSPEWKISGTAFKSVWNDESNEIDFAFTLGVSRYFGRE